MKKRDITTEILSKRKRFSNRHDSFGQAIMRLMNLFLVHQHLYPLPREENKHIKQELLRYFSVGFISCIEGYYRAIIKELIDHGSPFRDRVPKLDVSKFDIKTFTNIYDKKISIGEIISHLVKISSVGDIQRHMSTLLECDYFSIIQSKLIAGDKGHSNFYENAWEILDSTFSDRHVACHELNPKHKWTFKRAIDQWRVTFFTLMATEELLVDFGLQRKLYELKGT